VENKENLDNLFKDGLLEPDIPFNEQDWDKMASMLDVHTKRRRPVWLLWASAAAAVLLIGLFVVLFLPEQGGKAPVKSVQVAKQQPAPAKPTKPETEQPVERYAGNRTPDSKKLILPNATGTRTSEGLQQPAAPLLASPNLTPAFPEIQPSRSGLVQIAFDDHIQLAPAAKQPQGEAYTQVVKGVKKKMKAADNQKQGLTLSAMLAPDISYAKSSINAKVSSNVGLLATYGISPKLSLTSGAIYSNKYYNSYITGVNAYNLSGEPYDINAVCNVIDIPLNVNYKVLGKKGFSFGVNAGLSSYLMLKERYDYVYPQQGGSPNVISVEYRNQNQHFFGVANLAVSVERRISPRLSIGVQPFMKFPLTGIGAGDASLKSSGMSFSLNMNLFPTKKPGRFAGLRQIGSKP
jgi:hypothetical protein